ncbi:MAG: saccharopine dehydrogenase family protein [Planctomycetota bacterium]|jgi:saccharopine dehydrogenase (NAD+, L-lysine-forming)|nr:saccharopine dehydrogenase family protein [Planctomycetota bacterium]
MSKVLVIGAGGVGNVVAHKCAQRPEIAVTLASRTVAKCDAIAAKIRAHTGREIATACVNADDVPALTALIKKEQPDIVINVALPYQDLSIMDACLATRTAYLDTANYEPPTEAKFEYKWQWAYRERFAEAGVTAILGCGFDPGQSNLYCAYARDELFSTIECIDIVDCNAGNHGHAFATNFNPEINIREITQPGRYWELGEWKTIPPLSRSEYFDFPEVGERKMYLLYHEEEESLVQNIPGLKRIRFWMTFGDEYLTYLRVLQNVGLTSITPVKFEGRDIVPLKFLQALLPDPGSLSDNYTGKTSIGCLICGAKKDGSPGKCLIYNVCDHAQCHQETGAQAVSYTTGVPAALGAELYLRGVWKRAGVWNVEQLPNAEFMAAVGDRGLPWQVKWYPI